jgi:hypothetical protein
MHHPALHRNDDLLHLVPQPGLFERVNPAGRDRQVDGSSGAQLDSAHVRPSFGNFHIESALCEFKAQQ